MGIDAPAGPRLVFSLILALHFLHPCAAAEPAAVPPPLSLPDVERLALQHNPTLAQAAAAIDASRGRALQAGLYPNPTIGYQSDQVGVQGTAGELQGGFVQQTIITAGKLRLSRAKYVQEAREAEIRAMGQQLRVLNGVRCRFFEVLAVERMVEVHREMLRNAEETLRTTREMLNTGQANRAEVLLAEIEQQRAEIALRARENRWRAAWEELVAVAGTPQLPTTPLIGQLEPEGAPLSFEESLCILLRDSPELLAAQVHVVHDQITLQRERVQPIPNIEVQAYTGWNYQTSNSVGGMQVGVQVPLWNRNQGTIQQAQADLARSNAEVARVELSLRRRLAVVYQHYQTALQTSEIHRVSNLPKAKEALELMNEMYRQRRAPWMQVVELQRTQLALRSEYTQSLLDLRKAEVEIRGLLLVDGLTTPPPPGPSSHLDVTPQPR